MSQRRRKRYFFESEIGTFRTLSIKFFKLNNGDIRIKKTAANRHFCYHKDCYNRKEPPFKGFKGHSKGYVNKCQLLYHIRNKHSGNYEASIISDIRSYTKIPVKYENTKQIETFRYIKRQVVHHYINKDMVRTVKNLKTGLSELKYKDCLQDMKTITDEEKNAFAEAITDNIFANKLCDPHLDVVSGCYFPFGLNFRANGGLFLGSPDRKNNAKPHFLHGQSWDKNLRLTALAFNNFMNLLNTIGASGDATSRDVVCAKIAEEISFEERRAMLAIAKKKDHINKLYDSCSGRYRYEKKGKHKAIVEEQFPDCSDFQKHHLEMYKEQGQRCSISNIFLICNPKNALEALFQPSLDAKVAALPHVKGNTRIVCAFLNPSDTSSYHNAGVSYPVHCWTTELFRTVFRVAEYADEHAI